MYGCTTGKHRLGKTYVTRLKSVARGETDYWVHLRSGRPLLVIHDAANGSFAKMLREQVLPEIRRVIGEQRVTVVFDRRRLVQRVDVGLVGGEL